MHLKLAAPLKNSYHCQIDETFFGIEYLEVHRIQSLQPESYLLPETPETSHLQSKFT